MEEHMEEKEVPVGKPTVAQRLKAFSMKQWVLFGILAITALFMFIGLAFPVLHMKIEVFSYKQESTTLGFHLLGGSYPKALEGAAPMLMAFMWLHFLATLACIVLTLLVFFKPLKRGDRIQIAVMCLSLVFSVLYMIDGFVAISSVEGTYSPTTASYALFILVALFTVGYFVCLKFLPENFGRPKKAPRKADAADELKKYKELYDMGAITEEEFAQKKRELLN